MAKLKTIEKWQLPFTYEWTEEIFSREVEVWRGRGADRRKEVVLVPADFSKMRFNLGLSWGAGMLFEIKVCAASAFVLTMGLWLRRVTEQMYEQKVISESIMQKEWKGLVKNIRDTYEYKARMEAEE